MIFKKKNLKKNVHILLWWKCYTTNYINWQQNYKEKCCCYPELSAQLHEMIVILLLNYSHSYRETETALHEHKQYSLPETQVALS